MSRREKISEGNLALVAAINKMTWTFLVSQWSEQPVLNTSLSNGDIFNYTLDGVTRFRFIPNTYNSNQDAFYSGFDGSNLSGLITKRSD